MTLDRRFQSLGGAGRRVEDDVAAGDEGLDVGEAELLEEPAQVVHLDGPPADVDGAEEGDEAWHSVRDGTVFFVRWTSSSPRGIDGGGTRFGQATWRSQ